jgi:hypothetical protein
MLAEEMAGLGGSPVKPTKARGAGPVVTASPGLAAMARASLSPSYAQQLIDGLFLFAFLLFS